MKHRKTLLFAAAAFVALAALLTAVPGFLFSIVLSMGCAVLCVVFWLLTGKTGKAARSICKGLLAFVLAGCIAAAVTGGFILSAAHPAQLPACRYIIVLGAGVNGTVPSLTLRERINAAYDYLSANPESIAILSGGQGEGEDISEAACMYRELTALGISPSRLLQEDRSTSTLENLQFSLALAEQELGIRPNKVGIVSSEYHIFRAIRFASGLQLEAEGIPAKTAWFPLRLNYYLREIVAVWKYLLLGP